MGLFALIAAAGKAFDALPKTILRSNQHWVIEFLPDLFVVLLVLAIAPLITRGIEWRRSIAGLRARSTTWVISFWILTACAVVLLIPLSSQIRRHYQTRYQRAFLDWHAVKALDLFGTRRFDAAARELSKIAETSIPQFREILRTEIGARSKDSETLLRRSGINEEGQRPRAFSELLMVGRASRLTPQRPEVTKAMGDARNTIEEALSSYVSGVTNLRKRDFAAAAEDLRRSRTLCRGMLHQDLLLSYTRNPDLARYEADRRGLLTYYLETPDDQLRAALLAYPPIRQFAPRPSQLQ